VTSKYGGKRINALLDAVGRAHVLVGVLRGTGAHPNAEGGKTIAEIAWWNEFGTKWIPERSFLRTTIRAHNYYRDAIKEALLLAKKRFRYEDALQGLKVVGFMAVRDMRRKIVGGPFVANAPSTVRSKSTNETRDNKQKPLIDTGTLRKSIQYQIERGTGA